LSCGRGLTQKDRLVRVRLECFFASGIYVYTY